MTNPIEADLAELIPSKAKSWVGLVGSLLTFAVPYVVGAEQYLPSPWPAVIGVALAVLTALGIYKAPYVASGQTLAPDTAEVAAAAKVSTATPATPPSPGRSWPNPWKH